MPGAKGDFIHCYNAQAVVEQDSHIVVATHVSQAANDKQEMEPRADRVEEGSCGKQGSAGGGCRAVERCVEQDIEPYIAGSREHHNQPLEDRLNAVPECPADADAVTAMQHRLQTPLKGRRSIAAAEVHGGGGVRGDQGGAGIPALSSARVARRRGRMESGVPRRNLKRRPGRRVGSVRPGGRAVAPERAPETLRVLLDHGTTSIPREGPASAPDCALRRPANA